MRQQSIRTTISPVYKFPFTFYNHLLYRLEDRGEERPPGKQESETSMIAIASDHGGFALKRNIGKFLEEQGYEVRDLGAGSPDPVDYPDFAHGLAEGIADGTFNRGILICGTGIGMSMVANRHAGVRAALCTNEYMAAMARRHNDANVLCLGERVIGIELARAIVTVFLATGFEGGRHQKRVDKFDI